MDTDLPPDLQVLEHLRATCVLMRRNAESIELAKAILAEEERVARRIARLRAGLPQAEEVAA